MPLITQVRAPWIGGSIDERYSGQGRLSDIPYRETKGYVKKVRCAAESYKKYMVFNRMLIIID